MDNIWKPWNQSAKVTPMPGQAVWEHWDNGLQVGMTEWAGQDLNKKKAATEIRLLNHT